MASIASRREAFRRLHESGCFLIPNPWDVGSARYLRHLGFKALATTSSGCSFARGLPDAEWAVPRQVALAHIAEIAAATELPVNADFQAGYGREPADVAESVRLCVGTGVAGLSVEDATGDAAAPLFELSVAVSDLAALGVRRVSVGSALARAAWTGFIRAAKAMAEEGSFAGLDGCVPFAELNGFFLRDLEQR